MIARRIVIVGGGIAGLATAHRLSELSREHGVECDITLLEAQERFGGLIDSNVVDGMILEGGPDAFLTVHPWASDLCHRLGLADELLETRPTGRRSFVVRRGQLVSVPEGFHLMAPVRVGAALRAPLFSWLGKLRAACEPLIPARREATDESAAAFVRRRLGREVYERVAQPMLTGIYSADPEELSARAVLQAFVEMEDQHGSLIRGLRAKARAGDTPTRSTRGPRYSAFRTLQGGMGRFVDALVSQIPHVLLRCSTMVNSVSRDEGDETWDVTVRDGERLTADALCLALPAPRAALLLRQSAPRLAASLALIPYESVVTVNVVYRREDVQHPLDGFGFVVPATEGRSILGCSFSSVKFPGRAPDGMVILRVFVGGPLQRAVIDQDDATIERMVRDELHELLGIEAAPQHVKIRRFSQAMPQYHVGHLDRVTAIEERTDEHPGLFLTGNAYRGVGIPDCVHHAEHTAERIFIELTRPLRQEQSVV